MDDIEGKDEIEKFNAWYKKEQENGLIDLKFYLATIELDDTPETFARANNLFNEAIENNSIIEREGLSISV